MKLDSLVYSENELGKIDGKVANGLVRHSEKYSILGIIDSTKEGFDAGEYLDGIKNGIPVFRNLDHAIKKLGFIPKHFITFRNNHSCSNIIRACNLFSKASGIF